MPRGAREKQREQAKKERRRQDAEPGAPQQAAVEAPPGEPQTVSDPEVARVAAEIAARLGETEDEPRASILRAVQRLGAEAALALLEETLAIEAQGGMWLCDGSRRRTPGGVFFYLLHRRVEKRDKLAIFYPEYEPVVPLAPQELAAQIAGAAEWERAPAIQAQVRLLGRPARIPSPDVAPETPYVIFNLEGGPGRAPALSKGMPPLDGTTVFRVLAPTAQWRKLAPKLIERPEAAISVSGDAAINPKRPGVITVRAAIIRLFVPHNALDPTK